MVKDPASTSKFKPKKIPLEIVKGVSGYALPGQTLYVMGASGAGKTSLLNLISDRASDKNGNIIEGTVLVNNKDQVQQKTFGTIASFVMQDDILFEFMTVREALTFAARLRLHALTEEEQDKRVQKLLKDLGIWHVQNSLIGSVQKKVISGGERKRTSIGVELITDPSVVLLDEPTSGLDSFKALQVVKLLKRLARDEGKTIIATIHQPSS